MSKPIAFYPELSRELGGDPIAALFYQQLYYWSNKGKRSDGFIYKTKEEIEYETTLNRYQQDKARNKLVKLGWLEIKKIKANGSPTLHYKCLKEYQISISSPSTNALADRRLILEKSKVDQSITESTKEYYNGSAPVDVSAMVCPECSSPLRKRTGKRGPFLGCTSYPDCRYTSSLGPDPQYLGGLPDTGWVRAEGTRWFKDLPRPEHAGVYDEGSFVVTKDGWLRYCTPAQLQQYYTWQNR